MRRIVAILSPQYHGNETPLDAFIHPAES